MRRLLSVILLWLVLLSSVAHGFSLNPAEYPLQVKGARFTVFYDIDGPNATTPTFANEVLAHAEAGYKKLVVEGGLRAPRIEPVAILLQGSDDVLGGSVYFGDHGFNVAMTINPQMTGEFALGDVVAHELFHVIQAAYTKSASQPLWAIEGTAPLATLYTYGPDSAEVRKAMTGHLSQYYAADGLSMKDEPYLSSLFWYWTAEQYGGIKFLGRLLRWSEDVEWERAAQLAAIEGGAPADITFDKLWRSFILALVDGRMPKGYKTDTWFYPTQLAWASESPSLSAERTGIGPLGHRYTYWDPLVLGSYAYSLVEVVSDRSEAVALTVEGDPHALEAYLIEPGVRLVNALTDYAKRPHWGNVVAPPSDASTRGVQVPLGTPVRLGTASSRKLVLLVRTGNWGYSSYSMRLTPVSGDAVALAELAELAKIPHPADSVASPPPLTEVETAALRAGTYLSDLQPLKVGEVKPVEVKRYTLRVGSTAIRNGNSSIPLDRPVERDKDGRIWFPFKGLTEALGGKVESTREGETFRFGDSWIRVQPGGFLTLSENGISGYGDTLVKESGGVLMATLDIFGFLGVGISRYGDTYEFTYPHPRRAGD